MTEKVVRSCTVAERSGVCWCLDAAWYNLRSLASTHVAWPLVITFLQRNAEQFVKVEEVVFELAIMNAYCFTGP